LPWAFGGQARLLQRRHATWVRIPLDAEAQGQLIALSVRRDGLTVVAEDGLVLESGALPSDPSSEPRAFG
jgi:hypothetical protein